MHGPSALQTQLPTLPDSGHINAFRQEISGRFLTPFSNCQRVLRTGDQLKSKAHGFSFLPCRPLSASGDGSQLIALRFRQIALLALAVDRKGKHRNMPTTEVLDGSVATAFPLTFPRMTKFACTACPCLGICGNGSHNLLNLCVC